MLLKSSIAICTVLISLTNNAQAQNITLDDSLGKQQTLTGPNYNIPQSLGQTAGNNLFHSFGKFNLNSNEAAVFQSADNIQNILSRVTGGNPSSIDGLIRTLGKDVNFFLINPSGIVFGENARLDVSGSFVASTADSILFDNGIEFSANSQDNFSQPLLKINVPIGLQLGKTSTSPVINSGKLEVNSGKNISLLGSAVINTGKLTAPGGEIALVSTPGSTNIKLGNNGQVNTVKLLTESIDKTQSENGIPLLSKFLNNLPRETVDLSIPNSPGITVTTGVVDVSSNYGGNVKVLGSQVGLYPGSIVDASGDYGGGKVFIGGNPTGKGLLLNANATFISSQAQIKANALSRGNGGEIIVWSNNSTRSYGAFEAKGGAIAGNGGLIETSGRDFLDVSGITLDASANSGRGGTWLLDPRNVGLAYEDNTNGDLSGGNPNVFAPNGNDAIINITDIQSQLNAGTDVVITTDTGGEQEGNITALTTEGFGIIKTTENPAKLTLEAANNIDLDGGGFGIKSENGALDLILTAGGNINIKNGGIETRGGKFQADGNNIDLSAVIITDGGDFQANAVDNISIQSGRIETGAGKFITVAGDSINLKDIGIQTDGGEFKAVASNILSIESAGVESNNQDVQNAASMKLEGKEISLIGMGFKSSTQASGNAAPLIINAKNDLLINSAGIESLTTGKGRAGDVTLTANTIEQKQSGISSSTESIGNAGNVKLNAQVVNVDNSSAIKSYTLGSGNAGIIDIETNLLNISNNSGINTDTGVVIENDGTRLVDNTGNAGIIKIIAQRIFVSKNSGITSETASQGNAGEIRLQTSELELRNNANITTSTFPDRLVTGNAGLIQIDAKSVLFDNDDDFMEAGKNSGLGSATRGSGKGGTIILNADSVQMRSRGGIGVSTEASGDAGTLFLNANSLFIENAGITSEDRGTGKGGNLNFNINGDMILRGANISASAKNEQTQNNQNNQTSAGNIDIVSRNLLLENSFIQGESTSGNGGNIDIQVENILSLKPGSGITTTAGTDKTAGDGGNIDIDAQFIIAYPKANSDITANAFTGNGGRVNITSSGIFGIFPQNSPTNNSDITASSQTGINGEINIDGLDIDPSRGLIQLPTNLVDASQQISQACTPRGRQNPSTFVSTGRGGLPLNPNEPLRQRNAYANWVDLPSQTAENTTDKLPTPSVTKSTPKIIEAQKMVVDENGDIFFVAESPKFHTPSTISCN
ncbi:MAG: filamentous hemagglutinin N-terminal domain-containing protein [Cyanobacteria bacterium J06635_10]